MAHDSDPTSDQPAKPPLLDAATASHASPAARSPEGEAALPRGAAFGHYTIEGVLGAGGMGVVYRARQERPAREVALKVIRPGFASSQALRRFELEAEVLGRLQHPGIAQVYEAGTGPGSQPFFAMELVRGEALTSYAESRGLSTRARLELFAKVCDAVQHAHTKGIIHRDLKPGNILVDASGQPKILDFGVARLTGHDVQAVSIQTDIGQLIGTVPYMSPEQVEGNPANLDTRSDVYALGVILFELLTGRLPYDLSDKLIHEAVRIIREDEPTRLSSINRTLRGDIETIALKALEKDKGRRYQAASDLGSDITRFLRDEPIVARPASRSYQLRKFAKRNKALVGGVLAAFILLALGLAGTSWGMVRAEEQRRRADERAEAAQKAEAAASAARDAERARADELTRVSDFQSQMLGQIDTTTAGAELMKDVRERFAAALEKAGVPEAERTTRAEVFRSELVRVNATDAAAAMIDRTILRPAVKAIEERFKDQPVVDAQLRQALAVLYRGVGLHDAAYPLQESAVTTRRRLLGEEHPDTINSIGNMGVLLRDRGEFIDSERLSRDALDLSRRLRGDDHPDTIRCIINVGAVLQAQGKLTDAERFDRDALERSRGALGPLHEATLTAISAMGGVLHALGKYAEAEALCEESLSLSRRLRGDDHPETILCLNNLGGALWAQGRFDEAQLHWRESLERSRRVLGEDHPDTIRCLSNLGSLLDDEGRSAEAEPYLREALDKRRRVFGEDHPETLSSLNNMGFVLQAMGRHAEAEAIWRESLEKHRRALGGEHPQTLTAINNMAFVLQMQGEFAAAEPLFRESLERRRRLLGSKHPDTLTAINNMGFILQRQGKLADAEPFYREAMETGRDVLGEGDPQILGYVLNLSGLLRDQGLLPEAERRAREALDGFRRMLGDDHQKTLLSISAVGHLLRVQGKCGEAVELLAPAEAAARRAFTGDNAFNLASLLSTLGRARAGPGFDLERYSLADENLREAHEMFARVRGPRHPQTKAIAQSLVDLYTAWHAAEPGKGYDVKAAEWKARLDEVSENGAAP